MYSHQSVHKTFDNYYSSPFLSCKLGRIVEFYSILSRQSISDITIDSSTIASSGSWPQNYSLLVELPSQSAT